MPLSTEHLLHKLLSSRWSNHIVTWTSEQTINGHNSAMRQSKIVPNLLVTASTYESKSLQSYRWIWIWVWDVLYTFLIHIECLVHLSVRNTSCTSHNVNVFLFIIICSRFLNDLRNSHKLDSLISLKLGIIEVFKIIHSRHGQTSPRL